MTIHWNQNQQLDFTHQQNDLDSCHPVHADEDDSEDEK